MREIDLIKKLNQSYRFLDLKYSKLILALFLMLLTVFLEMAGLSILYPLVLILEKKDFASIFSASYSPTVTALGLFAAVIVIYIFKNIALYFTYEYNINFSIYYHRNFIKRIYSVYIHKTLLDFQKESAGSLSSIICDQVNRLVYEIIRPLLVILTELTLLVCVSSLVFFINPLLTFAIIFMCGLAGASFYFMTRSKALMWGKTRTNAVTLLHELVNSTSVGISEIKIFGKENFMIKKLSDASVLETKMFHHMDMFQQVPRWLLETVFIVTMLMFFSIQLLEKADLSILMAQFSVIAAAAFRILPSMNRLVHSYSSFSFYIGPATSLINTVLDTKLLETYLPRDNEQLSKIITIQQITFNNVSFLYPDSTKLIFNNLNLKIKHGQRIGIIGSSGSGKSTFLKLLAGLYLPTTGNITIDNIVMADSLKSWQQIIGYVPQESFIMPTTIRENIAFEPHNLESDEPIWNLLAKVGLADFVKSLPQQLDTEIGEKRIGLSGGQKQLICLARALFRHPKLLLLDEPTASLDINNEKLILNVINNLSNDVTIIMASHKLQNFSCFDLIYSYKNHSLLLSTNLTAEAAAI